MVCSNGWEVMHQSDQGICIFDNQLKKIYINEKAKTVFAGMGPELYQQFKNISKHVLKMIHAGAQTFISHSGSLRYSGIIINFTCFSIQKGGQAFNCIVFDYSSLAEHELAGHEVFTPREKEILQAVIQGRTNREISEKLCISLETVKSHIRNVFAKTGVGSRAELIGKVLPAATLNRSEEE